PASVEASAAIRRYTLYLHDALPISRALPEEWDKHILHATDGHETLEIIRAGYGDVVFLDLTMPGIEGYGVLETIRKEDLPAMVIVVSGDIQPDAQDRVK